MARGALADGAFPDELSVYLPVNAPQRIMLGTNFGLVISEDGGQSWRFVCELFITQSGADLVSYYKVASDGAVLAVTYVNLWRSPDGGCTWTRATGSMASLNTTDAFIDPADPSFVLALAYGSSGSGIYPSHDGGLTFGPPLYTTPDRLTGIEFARSKPGVVYATQVHPATSAGGASLLRSVDSGASWTAQPLQISSGTEPRIAAVDPVDASKVYLRLLTISASSDTIATTTDAGKTLTTSASLTGGVYFTSFLLASDGTAYAGTSSADLYVQPPGASTFAKRVGPRARCLGQRPGTTRIFACGDLYLDRYNLGYSDDGAQTFRPLMTFRDIAGPLTCPTVRTSCEDQYRLLLQTLGVGSDAGSGSDAGVPPPAKGSRCGSIGATGLTALLLVAFALRRRSRRTSPWPRIDRVRRRW